MLWEQELSTEAGKTAENGKFYCHLIVAIIMSLLRRFLLVWFNLLSSRSVCVSETRHALSEILALYLQWVFATNSFSITVLHFLACNYSL